MVAETWPEGRASGTRVALQFRYGDTPAFFRYSFLDTQIAAFREVGGGDRPED